jgi:molybdate transport repressor ModE-like protein
MVMTSLPDLESLRLLVAIADHGSIGAASREVGITQPAASKRMRSLEARWRLRLLDRSKRGSAITDDGDAVVSWARQVLHELEVMQTGIEALSVERRSGLAVAASLTVAEFMLPRWIGELRMQEPALHPLLRVVNSEQVADLVRNGDADVGFIETAVLPRSLSVVHLGVDALSIVTLPTHPWARRSTPLTQAALAKAEYVLREPGSGTRSTFERALRLQPQLALEAGSTSALVGAVLAGVGPAVVSTRAVRAYLDTGRLIEIPHELDLWRPISAITEPRRRFNEHAGTLIRIAQRAVRRDRADVSQH